MTDDLLAPNQPFYSSERVEQRLREEIERLRAEVATARNSLAVADSALAALRKRVDEAEVVEIQKMPASAFGVFCLSPQWVGKRVRLVVEE